MWLLVTQGQHLVHLWPHLHLPTFDLTSYSMMPSPSQPMDALKSTKKTRKVTIDEGVQQHGMHRHGRELPRAGCAGNSGAGGTSLALGRQMCSFQIQPEVGALPPSERNP